VDISYTGLKADIAVTRDILLTISGWLLVLSLVSSESDVRGAIVYLVPCDHHV